MIISFIYSLNLGLYIFFPSRIKKSRDKTENIMQYAKFDKKSTRINR